MSNGLESMSARGSTDRSIAVVLPLKVELFAEWQPHGPDTLSGLAPRKLRLAFAPNQSVTSAARVNPPFPCERSLAMIMIVDLMGTGHRAVRLNREQPDEGK